MQRIKNYKKSDKAGFKKTNWTSTSKTRFETKRKENNKIEKELEISDLKNRSDDI